MQNVLRIVVAQLNFWIGDIAGNTQKIIDATVKARDELKADIIIFPELAICGYPPEDLLRRADFHDQIEENLHTIQQHATGIDVALGHPHRTPEGIYNAFSYLRKQQVIATYHKQCLPNYGVFDEKRYFLRGNNAPCIIETKGVKLGLVVCEYVWFPEPIEQAKQAGAQLILSIHASPFNIDKPAIREEILRQRVQENALPIIYAHGVCGQDDLVFDGGSMAMNADGALCAHGGFYEEKLLPIDVNTSPVVNVVPQKLPQPMCTEASVYNALVFSTREYIEKNNFKGALVGVSGGIDSALTLAVAIDAIGKDRVYAIALPSRHTSQLSLDLIKEIAANTGVKLTSISIEPSFNAFIENLAPVISNIESNDLMQENLQARCRAVFLMAFANKTGKILLNTSNKSETAVGFGTLYGDMAGGFAVLKDVPKLLVYKLAKYRNSINPIIPQGIIERPPSAELADNQKDEDSLPPYKILDPILDMYVEKDLSLEAMVNAGFDRATVERVIELVDRSEFKRRQGAPGPRVTQRAFGRERRFPMTNKFRTR